MEFISYYTEDDEIRAVATVNRDPIAVVCAELMRRGRMPSVSELMLGTVTWRLQSWSFICGNGSTPRCWRRFPWTSKQKCINILTSHFTLSFPCLFACGFLLFFWLLCVKTSTIVWALGWWMVDGMVIGLDGFVNSSCVLYMISWQNWQT